MGICRVSVFGKNSFRLLMIIFCMIISVQALNKEGVFLLEFKKSLIDPNGNLQGWNALDVNPCNWTGIGCSDDYKVTSVHLNGLNLSGTLSSSICNLPYLTDLNVSTNFISGSIPPDLAFCQSLEVLDLCTNRFYSEFPSQLYKIAFLRQLYLCENYIFGGVPQEIGYMSSIEELVIYSNNLTGTIPSSIGRLKQLRIIRAGRNFLSGPIPDEISECESLEVLGLAENMLEGSFPIELQKLGKLTNLILWKNNFFGQIPPEIGNFSSLELLALHQNAFIGSLPKELGKLGQLKRLYIYTNQLNGTIPPELGNCSSAVEIDLSENHLSGFIPKELGQIPDLRLLYLFENLLQGEIPKELGQLQQLWKLDLSINNLTGTIPEELQNLRKLEHLQLFDNHLDGNIPELMGQNSNLTVVDLSKNNLVGSIPAEICRSQNLSFLSLGYNKLTGNIPHGLKTCKSLETLMLGDNLLTGSLPTELSKLQHLSALELYQNRFSGLIPPEVGNFNNLERLLLADNYFFGKIPPEIGNLVKLVAFNVSGNRLSGRIPRELGKCVKLQRLDLSGNYFAGYLPEEIGMLTNLELLKLSDNRFTGPIPSSLGDLIRLTDLQMGGNFFFGSIPVELGKLTSLQICLNISHNMLNGTIPVNLGNLQMLEYLYLNDNELVGEIPSAVGGLVSLTVCNVSNNNLVGMVPNNPTFEKMDSSNFVGNAGLCRFRCHLPSTNPSYTPGWNWLKESSSKQKIVTIVSAVVGLISLTFIVALCWVMKRQKPPSFVSAEDESRPDILESYYFPKEGFAYQDLVEATGNFSDSAVIGRGACGTVYKAEMVNGDVIAVKKLKSRGEGPSSDNSFHAEVSTLGKIRHRNIVKLFGFCYQQDSNLLLYEYMENGSLGELLHVNQKCVLNWNERYKIALGAAEGLCYLHHDCKPQIIHRDIKSNNILLDESFQAHVGDFGLAKLIDLSYSKSMSAVAGSYGYIAPEYAYTMKVTEKCDIYSFGVVLLELITGKSPVQPLDQGGDLVTWVKQSIHKVVELSEIYDKRLDLISVRNLEEISLVLKIALFCTSTSPLSRPTMREVVAMLIDAREGTTISSPSSPTSETPLDENSACKGYEEP
ncbi:OLC1v1023441C1 [Oldenlandia corymbosa var. corymbosa]|uniref:non-specific serine/threonine protein kinase n=1 Tax=Oldenlandia corymbosa var. corymbosa TaxID=529605 RepID=A0AAV1C1D1_OLDCO|nr:OLC1v1023441C1 [Oldenlandia corymbosa var. corymbosa]